MEYELTGSTVQIGIPPAMVVETKVETATPGAFSFPVVEPVIQTT